MGNRPLFPLLFVNQVRYSPQTTEKMASIYHNARYGRLSPTDSWIFPGFAASSSMGLPWGVLR